MNNLALNTVYFLGRFDTPFSLSNEGQKVTHLNFFQGKLKQTNFKN